MGAGRSVETMTTTSAADSSAGTAQARAGRRCHTGGSQPRRPRGAHTPEQATRPGDRYREISKRMIERPHRRFVMRSE